MTKLSHCEFEPCLVSFSSVLGQDTLPSWYLSPPSNINGYQLLGLARGSAYQLTQLLEVSG